MKIPLTIQTNTNNCGPACLKMVADYYGKFYDLDFLNLKCKLTKRGASMLKLSKAARAIGFECRGVKMGIEQLKEVVQEIPVILHWEKNHFVVVYKTPKPNRKGLFYIADPAKGFKKYQENAILKSWLVKRNGYCLLIEQ